MGNQYNSASRLVYSTDVGRVKEDKAKEQIVGDGNVRVRPEKRVAVVNW